MLLKKENLLFGIEIETQNEKESRRDSSDFDQSEYHSEICDEIHEIITNATSRDVRRCCIDGNDYTVSYDTAWENVLERLVEDADDGDPLDVSSAWEKHNDSTVEGWEYVFSNPRNYSRTIEVLQAFPWGDAEIDVECSFHIHVSWPNIEHWRSRQLKLLILLGKACIENDTLRLIVSARIENKGWQRQYYAPRIGNDRYCAIAQRAKNNSTYEYRIFGYVTNFGEATVCVDHVAEACIHASQDNWPQASVKTCVNEIEENTRKLDKFLDFCCDEERDNWEVETTEFFRELLQLVPERTDNCVNNVGEENK